ncbi:AT-rich interactive domain-containing protein 2 [Gastrolobium bilobum]|uniref:AT-rich interactive domain-containing protein 2 n=1 Tax=Gastrolobium bilobum TaxID=150636 RepID=UPI002AB1D690|nr:AT-rich interactive domain-containing protein 2 [Gastrolobium bilobum]
MHPSLYDDGHQGLTYNLRKRLKRDKRHLVGKSSTNGVSSGTQRGLERIQSPHTEVSAVKKSLDSCTARSSLDRSAKVPIPLGPAHQAEVPQWTGMTYESDSKWLGTQIWPTENVNSKRFFERQRQPIGKGRGDSCGCQVQGSVECVRFHIVHKRTKLKLELGEAFYKWNLHKVGEEVRRLWTREEEKKFKDVVKSNPPSLERCFWDHIFKAFPMKSREDLVSYYFNVFILQRRGYQNRHTLNDIDSDDDGSEFGPSRKVFGHKSRSSTLLPPKSQRQREDRK